MITLYKYFFCKAYYFCIQVFKEREFPWFFASGAISMPLVLNLIVIWELIEYIIRPSDFEIIGEYYGYFSLGGLIITAFYVKSNDHYLTFLDDFKDMTKSKKKILGGIGVIYVLSLIAVFLFFGSVTREYIRNH